jgi:hypothetical protein
MGEGSVREFTSAAMSLAFFPRSRVTTTSGGGEAHAVNLPGAAAGSSLLAGRAPKIRRGREKKGVREDETAMADGMRVPGPGLWRRKTLRSGPHVSLPLQIWVSATARFAAHGSADVNELSGLKLNRDSVPRLRGMKDTVRLFAVKIAHLAKRNFFLENTV